MNPGCAHGVALLTLRQTMIVGIVRNPGLDHLRHMNVPHLNPWYLKIDGSEVKNQSSRIKTFLQVCHEGRTTGCRGWDSRRCFVYELLLTREKFYEGAGYICIRTGTGPRDMDHAPMVWIPFPWCGFHSRGLGHEVALPLRALRRAGGTDAFVTKWVNQ